MSGKRETAIAALLTKLQTVAGFTVTGRRNAQPDTIATPNNPALLLLCNRDKYGTLQLGRVVKKTMMVFACIYIDTGNDPNAVPDTIINNLLDGVDDALVPDDLAAGRCTLGGAVFAAHIEGEVIRAPGDRTGKGLAIVPINLILP